MALVFNYTQATFRSGGWLFPFSSPAAALAMAKLVTFLLA